MSFNVVKFNATKARCRTGHLMFGAGRGNDFGIRNVGWGWAGGGPKGLLKRRPKRKKDLSLSEHTAMVSYNSWSLRKDLFSLIFTEQMDDIRKKKKRVHSIDRRHYFFLDNWIQLHRLMHDNVQQCASFFFFLKMSFSLFELSVVY